MTKLLLSISLFLSCLIGANESRAALSTINGYVCSAMYTRQNNVSFGQGFVRVQVNAGVSCTGSNLGSYYYLGSGATISGFQFSEAERLQLFEQALKASKDGTRASLFVETSGGGIFHTTYSAN